MSELKKEELLVLAEYAFGEAMCVKERKVEPQDLNQAYQQIKALIQKLGVTEEWIEKKAKEFISEIGMYKSTSTYLSDNILYAKNFIRSLVEEIQGVA